MHGVSKAAQLLPDLQGLELTQVCIGFNDVILNFATGDNVGIYTPSFFTKNRSFLLSLTEEDPQKSPFGKTISSALIQNEEIVIMFSNGDSVIIQDDSREYESAKFEVGGATIII